jgi:hypothetical protein
MGMTTYIVEGRRFQKYLHAITFARHQAKTLGRGVEVRAEVEREVVKAERKWIATMHPPGTERQIETAIKQPLRKAASAGGE